MIYIFLASKIKTEKDKSPSQKTKKRWDKIFLKPPPYHRVAFNYFLEAVPRKDIFTSVKYFKV